MLLHTLQVLGITNYSHWKLAGPVRQCLHNEPPPIQQLLLSLALKQLRHFVHVGVTEMLDESIEALAVSLGHQLACMLLAGKQL